MIRRRFIVVAADIEELASQAPLAARCISAALMISHGLRRDCDLVLSALRGPSIHFVTSKLRRVVPDEASLLGVLNRALKLCRAPQEQPRAVHSGVIVDPSPPERYLLGFPQKFRCSTTGADIRRAFSSGEAAAFLVPFSEDLASLEERVGTLTKLKCPLDRMWPDQVIAVINILLDRLSCYGGL